MRRGPNGFIERVVVSRPARKKASPQKPSSSTWSGPAITNGMTAFHAWRPIAAPTDPAALAVPELRGFTRLWLRQRERLAQHDALKRFDERMARWWSIETGVIERLYDVSAGATLVLVEHGFVASLLSHGDATMEPEALVRVLKDHRGALDMVMDVVGGTRTLSLGWIKELHALMTRNQEWTEAVTPTGELIRVPLERGTWKSRPNNPRRRLDDLVHEYCPPEHVQSEMERLLALHAAIPDTLPEVRAGFLHHAFTQIHPFQDGNGRVARALASIDFIRAGLFPLLVQRSDKERHYLPALEKADQGDLGPLVRFFGRCLERVLTRAISEAEGAVGEADSLSSVLDAAAQKVTTQRPAHANAIGLMRGRLSGLGGVLEARLQAAAKQTEARVPNVKTKVFVSKDETAHFYRRQLVELGKIHRHWVDLHEPRTWASLRLTDGGITNVTLAIHFVGNPSPGTCVAVAFLEHRKANDEELGSEPIVQLDLEPLLLASEEDPDSQLQRLATWADAAVLAGLARWIDYL